MISDFWDRVVHIRGFLSTQMPSWTEMNWWETGIYSKIWNCTEIEIFMSGVCPEGISEPLNLCNQTCSSIIAERGVIEVANFVMRLLIYCLNKVWKRFTTFCPHCLVCRHTARQWACCRTNTLTTSRRLPELWTCCTCLTVAMSHTWSTGYSHCRSPSGTGSSMHWIMVCLPFELVSLCLKLLYTKTGESLCLKILYTKIGPSQCAWRYSIQR